MKFIKMENGKIWYKKMLSEKEVLTDDIVNCYKRVEEATATTCCSRSDFSMAFLMLVLKNQEVLKLEATAEVVDSTLQKIKDANPKVIIGYKK